MAYSSPASGGVLPAWLSFKAFVILIIFAALGKDNKPYSYCLHLYADDVQFLFLMKPSETLGLSKLLDCLNSIRLADKKMLTA